MAATRATAQRRVLQWLALGGVVVIAALVAGYFVWPTALVEGPLRIRRTMAGLHHRVVITPDGPVPYLTGGSGEQTIVLLHGFEQDKDVWVAMARDLRDDHRVVIPDQFGFGENIAPVHGDYRPDSQARRLRAILEALNLRRVELVGWSMGGEVAAAFAMRYPEMVSSLALISSAGVRPDTLTPLDQRLLAGERLFHVTDARSLDAMLAEMNDSGTPMRALLKRAMVVRSRRRAAQWDTVFQQLSTEPALYQLDSIAPRISTRTLVLWGAKDPLYHVSAARRLAARLPNAELEILPDCGHICPVSRTAEVVARYREFLRHHAPAFAWSAR